jgi:hypothetical protein
MRVMGINGIAAVLGSLGGGGLEVPLERLVRESCNAYGATEEQTRFTIRRGVKAGAFRIKTKKGQKWVALIRYGKNGERK